MTDDTDAPPEESDEELVLDDLKVDLQFLLERSFESERRYGDLSWSVRNAMYIQGYIALSGAALLNSQQHYILATGAGLFCLIFTLLLYVMHDHFVRYYFDCLELIKNLEAQAKIPEKLSYIASVQNPRHERVRNKLFGWVRVYGPFALMGIAAASITILSVVQILNPKAPTEQKIQHSHVLSTEAGAGKTANALVPPEAAEVEAEDIVSDTSESAPSGEVAIDVSEDRHE